MLDRLGGEFRDVIRERGRNPYFNQILKTYSRKKSASMTRRIPTS